MAEKNSSRVFLLVAVALGVVATVMAFAFLERTSRGDQGPKVKILVAKHDLKVNQILDPEKDLSEFDIPAGMVELRSRCLVPEDRGAYRNQRIVRKIPAGTPVMRADLVVGGDIELRGDMRALAIPVKGAAALGGLLVPGDWVKVYVTRPLPRLRAAAPAAGSEGDTPAIPSPTETIARWESKQVLPAAAKVLAVGPRLSRTRQQITAADQLEMSREVESQQTVTLEVTEQQAQTILQETGAGQLPITLVLCPAPTTGPLR